MWCWSRPCGTIRATTLDRLEQFQAAGGEVIFVGEVPSLVDAVPSERPREFAQRCHQIPFTRKRILEALAPFCEVAVWLAAGRRSDSILHQMRVDGDRRYVFFCNTDKEEPRLGTRIAVAGAWRITVLDALNGTTYSLRSQLCSGHTLIEWDFPAHGSLLLALDPGWTEGGVVPVPQTWSELARLGDPVPVTLSEPNVLLLDMAMYRLNDEDWQAEEEVLRIDTLLRARRGLPPPVEDTFAQPWLDTAVASSTDTLNLKFTIRTGSDIAAPSLALENATQVTIQLDGLAVPSEVSGWFVDEAIQTVPLPPLTAGMHELVLAMPYGPRTSLEWCYLLGDFGVEVHGRYTRIVAPVRTLAFGDWTRQGLPFYTGNVTYHCIFVAPGNNLAIRTPRFNASLLAVTLDGREVGKLAFAPFQLELGVVPKGRHTLAITAYGNRFNAFGCIHNANEKVLWCGPDAWRTSGDEWSYEYQIKPMGLLSAPRLMREDNDSS